MPAESRLLRLASALFGVHHREERDIFDLSVPSPSPGHLDSRPAWDCVGDGASSLVPLLRRERERGRR